MKYAVDVEYTDDMVTELFEDEDVALRFAKEELRWENTLRAVVTDNHNQTILDETGSFC